MTIFVAKVAQISGDFLGYFGKHHYFSRNSSSHFVGKFGKTLAYFSLSSGHTAALMQSIDLKKFERRESNF